MKKSIQEMRNWPWWSILYAMLTVVLAGLLPNALLGNDLLKDWNASWGIWDKVPNFVVVALFVFFSLKLFENREDFVPAKMIDKRNCEPKAGLIIPLSPYCDDGRTIDQNNGPKKKGVESILEEKEHSFVLQGNGKQYVFSKGVDIREHMKNLCSEGMAGWNGMPLLRALLHHQETLQKVYLIGSLDDSSRGSQGSYYLIPLISEFIKFLVPNAIVESAKSPLDYNDFNSLKRTFEDGIAFMRKKGLVDEEVIVDVTGGTKPISIAGAAATLHNKVTFQYIDTNNVTNLDKTQDVVQEYDVVTRKSTEVA